ncbi:capsule-associated protein-like protein CAP1 [Clohesyomyces aquaticus]|uniref:Capsule-associated protein-like protein CAP1 n=1 Tax=Clohesyomyces aquaticus TaxID=1231657 RepID=A0A1Y1YJ27_9PLEO|nr:capsule-associated protein-like protein CAP1 [Clohesyomyces aquaticus]
MAFSPRRFSPAIALKVLLFFALSVILVGTAWLWQRSPRSVASISMPHDHKGQDKGQAPKTHPIDDLIEHAGTEWFKLMAKQTHDLSGAAKAYRARRGRHPPPGFDRWYQFAKDNNAVMVEDFFDQIYDDLAPFWGVEAKKIRRQAKRFDFVVSVRNGTATQKTDHERPWMNLWHDLTSTIQEHLPDIDIPINVMDESRVIVPWEDINEYVKAERGSRKLVPRPEVVTELMGLEDVDADAGEPIEIPWVTGGLYWDTARVGCPPNSPAREVPASTNFSGPPPMPSAFPERSYYGYVKNWTAAKDPCLQPDLRESHGTFIEPLSQRTTHSLFPMFGGSKLPMNNDILIPPAMYWTKDPFYSGGEEHGGPWEQKTTKVVWRGGGTGGRNKAENWTRFQRHRFVAMVNGTAVQVAEKNAEGPGRGENFVLQGYHTYHLTATQYMDLGTWLNQITDVGMVHLICFPESGSNKCPYTDHYFEVKSGMPMAKQYAFKFLPDIDGNSFSGRYRGFMASTSLPIKATIYAEWHDSRLVPWVHFVPMDNSFVDIYGILDYFIGTGLEYKTEDGKVVEGAHDAAAEKIATAGKEWAEKVLRREDMQIYVMRLFMEYARICDDQRDRLGFIWDMD